MTIAIGFAGAACDDSRIHETAPEWVVHADEALMQQYRDGDAEAFRRLYQRHREPLYRFVLRLIGSAAEADEIFQEVWMAIVHGRGRYVQTASFRTYLYSIAHRRVSDRLRRRYVRLDDVELTEDDVPADAPGPDEFVQSAALGEALLQAVSVLPASQRIAFLLQAEAGLSLADIAAVTGAKRKTVKSRLRYAARRLRVAMEGWR